MFHKILAAMDRSVMGQYVFEKALALGKATDSQLMLLHVLSPYEEGYPDLPFLSSLEYYSGSYEEVVKLYLEELDAFKEAGLKMLRSRWEMATAAGVSTEFTQTPGTPGYAICDLALTWEADLVIVGRRGLSGLSELVLGSVSNYVTHHAPCSVLTVHLADPKQKLTQQEITDPETTASSPPNPTPTL